MGLFEITIALAVIIAAPVVFWFFYSIIAVRLGWEPRADKRASRANVIHDGRRSPASA